MIDIARENRGQTDATQRTLLAESYFGLKLAQEVVRVRQETYNSLQRHYQNALKLDAASHLILPGTVLAAFTMGLITRTARSNLLDVMSTDYIRTAKAKGLSRPGLIIQIGRAHV